MDKEETTFINEEVIDSKPETGGAPQEPVASRHESCVDEYEHVVDINDPTIVEKIAESKALFAQFAHEYGEKFDLADETSIDEVLKAAEELGIFEKAKEMRLLIFGKNISVYGVSYICNVCSEQCKFCPMGVCNHKMEILQKQIDVEEDSCKKAALQVEYNELGKKIRTLNLHEAKKDFEALREIGHQEICVLTGSGQTQDYEKIIPYAQWALNTPGVKEVILNVAQFPPEVFRNILSQLSIPEGVKIQFRIFQETYDKASYEEYMEYGRVKRNFEQRRDSQVNALLEGFDHAGIGVLFGLSRYPIKEIIGLMQHAAYIKQITGKQVSRCNLPIANKEGNPDIRIDYPIGDLRQAEKITILIYALASLAIPDVTKVSSERDTAETLEDLDPFASHTTLGVQDRPAGNIDAIEKPDYCTSEDKPVGQCGTHPRDVKAQLRSWLERGYNILHFDWEKYFTPEELREIEKNQVTRNGQ